MPEADGDGHALYTGVVMIAYTEREAVAYTEYLVDKAGFGSLNAWTVSGYNRRGSLLAVLDLYRKASDGIIRRVLDIGCGTGEAVFQLYDSADEPSIVEFMGVNMFRHQTVPSSLWPDGTSFFFGDFEKDDDLEDCLEANLHGHKFDLVMINYTLGHMDNLGQVFDRVARLTRPGATLGIYDIARASVTKDSFLGYHLWSRREVRQELSRHGFDLGHIWHPEFVLDEELFMDDSTPEMKQKSLQLIKDWKTWTLPYLLTARRNG